MTPRWNVATVNVFLLGYALDAGVSLMEELLRSATGFTGLAGLRNGLALLVLYAALLLLPLLALTPRLPTLGLLALIGSVLWLNLGAAPLPLLVESPTRLGILLASLQGLASIAAFLWVRRRNGGLGWLFAVQPPQAPFFSWRHSLTFGASCVFVLLPLGIAYLIFAVGMWIQLATGEFLRFDAQGVALDDRSYVRDGREVRLVGMMHIGEGEAYQALVQSFVAESTVVLAEGVTDEQDLLDVAFSYERAARALGLEQQEELSLYLAEATGRRPRPWPVMRHADLDLGDFAPETVEWIGWMARVWDSEDPATVVLRIAARVSERPDEWRLVERDILQRRNEHLIGELERALPEYRRVVVPWGALHLPAIEQAVLERGFVLSEARSHRLLSWTTLIAALR